MKVRFQEEIPFSVDLYRFCLFLSLSLSNAFPSNHYFILYQVYREAKKP